jgi:hypothetical protein
MVFASAEEFQVLSPEKPLSRQEYRDRQAKLAGRLLTSTVIISVSRPFLCKTGVGI